MIIVYIKKQFDHLDIPMTLYRQKQINQSPNASYKEQALKSEIVFQRGFYHYTKQEKIPIIDVKEQGKPYIKEGPYFNLSHSHDMFACGFGDLEIGVDIEKHQEKHLGISSRIMSSREHDEFLKKNPEEKLIYFFKHWTIKEAYIKYYGQTILQDMKKIEVRDSKVIGPMGTLQYKSIELDHYSLSVVSKKIEKIEIIHINES